MNLNVEHMAGSVRISVPSNKAQHTKTKHNKTQQINTGCLNYRYRLKRFPMKHRLLGQPVHNVLEEYFGGVHCRKSSSPVLFRLLPFLARVMSVVTLSDSDRPFSHFVSFGSTSRHHKLHQRESRKTFNPAVVALEDNTGGERVSCCQSTHGNGGKQSRQR